MNGVLNGSRFAREVFLELTLRRRGVTDVTVVEAALHLLAALGPAAGRFAEAFHRARGIRVECGAQVTEFHGSGQVEAVELGDGRRLGADLVLLALGSVANTEWLAGSGLQLDGGAVACDARCYASGRPDVVAAGDVASWIHDGLADRSGSSTGRMLPRWLVPRPTT